MVFSARIGPLVEWNDVVADPVNANVNSDQRFSSSVSILLAALLILLITLAHTSVYGKRNYREDEINSIHAALIKTPAEIVEWMAGDVHPPGWRLAADFWVDSFGTAESVTRWSSKLINLLTFALVFQLGGHLLDRRLAFYAVLLLGVYGFASNGMFEFRPYASLVAVTSALHLVYFRWLHRSTPRLMLVYVALGIAAIFTHFFVVFVFAAHAAALLLFRRFQRKFYRDSILLWVFIGLSFLVWLPSLLSVMLGPFSGGYYTGSLSSLYEQVHFRPEVIFGLLILTSLFAPRLLSHHQRHSIAIQLRWRRHWPLIYPLALLLATILIAFAVNSVYGILNARGLQTIVMLIALMMALGLRLLPTPAGLILLALLYLQAPAHIAVQPSNAPYREMAGFMESTYQHDSLLVTEFDFPWRWLTPAAYFMMDFTPDQMAKSRMYHVIGMADQAHPPTYPDELENIFDSFDGATFDAQIPAHGQLWLLQQGGGNRWGAAIQEWLDGNYALVRSASWDEPYDTNYQLSEYLRAPDVQVPVLVAGDNMELHAWSLLDSVEVEPCQRVTVESWWQLSTEDRTPYTLSIILPNRDGDKQLAKSNAVPGNVFTSDWTARKYYRNQTQLEIPCDIGGGSYDLLLAVKETISGNDLPLRHPDGESIGHVFYLTTLHAQVE